MSHYYFKIKASFSFHKEVLKFLTEVSRSSERIKTQMLLWPLKLPNLTNVLKLFDTVTQEFSLYSAA